MKKTHSIGGGSGTPPLFPRHPSHSSSSSSKSKPPPIPAPPQSPISTSSTSSSFATPRGSPVQSTIDGAWDAMLPTPGRRRRFGLGGGGGGSPLAAMGGGGFWMKRAESSPALGGDAMGEGALVLPADATAAGAAGGRGGSLGRSASSTALAVWGERLAGSGKALLGHSPRDAVGGVSGGVASVAAGLGLGLTSLVAAPALGAASHGAKGFFAGLGAGVAGAVVLPVAGLVGGLTCAIGGVVNTPASVVQMLRGRQWCPLQRQWIRYDLQEEARRVLGDSAASAASAASYEPSGSDDEDEGDEEVKVKEGGPSPDQPRPSPPQPAAAGAASGGKGGGVSLYAILGVDPSADAEAIKRAYYREALSVHPDRNTTGEPDATRRFQQLSEAYQVLSTPSLRAAYDKEGDAGYRDAVLIDADLFFGMVFGAERFRPYLGKLFLASAMGALSHFAGDAAATGGPPTVPTPAAGAGGALEASEDDFATAGSLGEARRAMTSTQVKREVRIALHLARVLRPWLEGRQASFLRFCAEEAQELGRRALGPLILQELGVVYKQVAGQYLGGLSGFSASLGRRRVRLQRQAEVAGATVEAVRLGKRFIDVYNPSSSNPSPTTPQTRRPPHRSQSAPALHSPSTTTSTSTKKPQTPSSPAHSDAPTTAPSLSASSSAASFRLPTPPPAGSSTPLMRTPEAPAYYRAHHAAPPSVGGGAGKGEECKEEEGEAVPSPPAGVGHGGGGSSSSSSSSSKEQKLEEEGLPRLVLVMWKLAAWDITETVGRACGKLLSDAGAGKEERRLRAQGLLELGQAFAAEAERCLAAQGGKVDYRREWEELDKEMFRRYESSASIHTMAAVPPRPGSIGSMGISGIGSGSVDSAVAPALDGQEGDAGEEEEEEEEGEEGLLVL